VEHLKKYFPIRAGILQRQVAAVHAVDDVSFSIKNRETFGIVGESGCGKTTLLMVLQRLIEPTSGLIRFMGEDILKLRKRELNKLRLKAAMIFQDPYASLDPRMTIADIISEPLEVHGLAKGKEKIKRVKELLREVGLPEYYVYRYPHQLSGGEKQRVGIARALAVTPHVLFADEPVASLDVSVRAKILNLINKLHRELNLTSVYVSHDLRTVKHLCDRVAVMYVGKIVELASAENIYEKPLHPYTKALISAIPRLERARKTKRIILKGEVPTPINPPPGCRFYPRCVYAENVCSEKDPELIEVKDGHFVACHVI